MYSRDQEAFLYPTSHEAVGYELPLNELNPMNYAQYLSNAYHPEANYYEYAYPPTPTTPIQALAPLSYSDQYKIANQQYIQQQTESNDQAAAALQAIESETKIEYDPESPSTDTITQSVEGEEEEEGQEEECEFEHDNLLILLGLNSIK